LLEIIKFMYKNIRQISKRNREVFILNKDGFVVRIPLSDKKELDKYAPRENLDKKAPEFIGELADLGLLRFKNYKPKERKINFDEVLVVAKGMRPIYGGPVIAHLAITGRCNMRCKYCSVRKVHSANAEELTTEEYKIIIKKLSALGVFQIGLTGGEPTLRNDIVELAGYITSLGIACNMTTNGWSVSEQLAKNLCKKGGLEQSQVSLDSYIKEHHENLRGTNSYARALKTIGILQNAGMKVGVDCVVSKNNIADIPKFVDFLARRKIPGLTLIKLKKGDLPLDVFQKLLPDYEEYGKLIADLCRRENAMPEVTIDCASVCNLHYSMTREEQAELHSAGCPAGHTLISIAPNGDLYPCAALSSERFKLGNALRDDLAETWKNNRILRDLRNIKEKVRGACRGCDRLDSCRAGCRGIANELDNLYASDPSCAREEVSENG